MFSLPRVHSSREKMRCLGNKKFFSSARTASTDFSVSPRLVNSRGFDDSAASCRNFRRDAREQYQKSDKCAELVWVPLFLSNNKQFFFVLRLYVIFSQSKSHIFIGFAVTLTIKFITKLSRNKCCRKITPSSRVV